MTTIFDIDLANSDCALSHVKKHKVIDYIYQKFKGFDIIIPVCDKCVDKLYNDDWILLYCINCAESIWIYKPDSKHRRLYNKGEHVKWMDMCPVCGLNG